MDEQRITHPVDTATLQKLSGLSRGLLKLHKALLELERGKYERVYGQVSSGDLLHLVLNHPQFAWLRPISELIVLIDEQLDAEEPITAAAAAALLARARTLITPAETGTDFERGYYTALQQEPAIVLAHGEVKRLLTVK